MSQMKKVLLLHNSPQRFVSIDKTLLQEKWQVYEYFQNSRWINISAIVAAIYKCDLVYCWFASWHSLAPAVIARLLGRPCIIVIGGYDTASLPNADYGSQRYRLPRLISRTVIHLAEKLTVFSQSAYREALANAGADPRKLEVIYLGFMDTHPTINPSRTHSALNVGGVWRENLLRKGLLPFVQAAKYLPDMSFIHVGRWYDNSISDLRAEAPRNVTFNGFVDDTSLLDLYGHSAVYVQPSLHEGFGMSVAEAMLGGCIPVVTRIGALPEVTGDTGIYCVSNSPEDVAHAIDQALLCTSEDRRRAKDYILENFPMERRRVALHNIVERLVTAG